MVKILFDFNFFASVDESADTIKMSKEFVSRMEMLINEISER